ncbi:MAG TPA: NAD(P)-binding domain-containing protein, partial [Thermohalobaculum sp.]|nr:NAD(P)-binding domain-containing protein [Thermohalobaculum sp.]
MAKIGFIGLGNMGLPMARNLLKAGHEVAGFDLSDAACAALVEAGGRRAKDIADAVKGAEAVVTALPAAKHVRGVYQGQGGILDAAAKGTLFIDCSTIDVDTARAVIAEADARGQLMVDSPMSGGVGGATAGTLTFMVGGSDAAFAAAKPVLQA